MSSDGPSAQDWDKALALLGKTSADVTEATLYDLRVSLEEYGALHASLGTRISPAERATLKKLNDYNMYLLALVEGVCENLGLECRTATQTQIWDAVEKLVRLHAE